MMGPLREALIAAAREGKLGGPTRISDAEWRDRLAELYPNATPEQIEAECAAAEDLWDDGAYPDYGV